MPNPTTLASRSRSNRSPFSNMADKMYPEDLQLDDESTAQEENAQAVTDAPE